MTEPTFEGLTRLFAEGQPSLGIFADEGGQFIGGHAMNSDNRLKTMAGLNDLWQGNPSHPSIFPFKLQLNAATLRKHPCLRVQRQGDQSDFVELA